MCPTAEGGSVGVSASTRVQLRVRGGDGRVRSLEFTGLGPAEAVRRAVARGLQVLAIDTPVAAAPVGGGSGAAFPLLLFSQELLALLDAGLNLTEALDTLWAKERQPAARAVLADLLGALRQGRNFSDVLAAAPRHFPEVYVATVRASERTGDLPRALARYIAYQQQFDGLRKKLVAAAIYPVMLLAVGGFVTLFLLGYVVPRFASVYESAGRELPWMSAALLSFGLLIHAFWPLALGALAVAGAGLVGVLGRAAGRAWLLEQVLRLPGFAARANEFRLARFYRALGLLLASGIALPRALGMVGGLLGAAQRAGLARSRLLVEQGLSLSQALGAEGLASAVAGSLLQVGERSGQLADMLERTARFHDEAFARWIDWASRLLEPLLMTLIGLVIGTVVVLMYMPIFELAGSLQ